MIKQLKNSDLEETVEFLSSEPTFNLFILGDIENFGFESEIQTLWGTYSDKGELEGILLRYRKSYIPYVKSLNVDLQPFIKILMAAEEEIVISGKKDIIEKLTPLFSNHRIKDTFFCELTAVDLMNSLKTEKEVKLAKADEADKVFELIKQIEEFRGTVSNTQEIREKIEKGAGRVYYLEDDHNDFISIAQTSAENSQSAMIVGVCTRPDYQGKGLISQCLIKLSQDLLAENKSLCLFYDNPNAGKLYHKLGFETIGEWRILSP